MWRIGSPTPIYESFLEWVGGATAVLDRDPTLLGERLGTGSAAELAVTRVLHAPASQPVSGVIGHVDGGSVEATGWMTVAGPKLSEARMSMSVVTSVSTSSEKITPADQPGLCPAPVTGLP